MRTSRNDNNNEKLAKVAGLKAKKNNLTGVLMKGYFKQNATASKIQSDIRQFLEKNNPKINGKTITPENIRVLGGNNNLNLVMRTDEGEIVITMGVKRPSADAAVEQLRNYSNPPWLVKHYGQVIYEGKTERILDEEGKFNADFNPFPTQQFGFVSFVEKCHTSLEARVNEVHRTESDNDPKAQNPIKLARFMGLQISNILSTISMNELIWMDFKPENLLLRANDQIVIADTKAFIPVNQLLVTHGGKRVFDDDMFTQAYVSEDYIHNKKATPCTRDEFKKIWEKEYSHQLAMTLYHIATAHRLNTPMINPYGSKFDFSHQVFQCEKGQQIKTVIEKLSENKPENRIRHEDAAALLKVLGHSEKFEMEMQIADAALKVEAAKTELKAGTSATLLAMIALMGGDIKSTAIALDDQRTLPAETKPNSEKPAPVTSTESDYDSNRDSIESMQPIIGSGRSKGH